MSMTSDSAAHVMPTPPDAPVPHRVVGVIGGMGPEATVDLMRRVIAKTPANDDQDHIHLIVESNPKISSRIAHLIERTGPDPTPELIQVAQNLQRAGAQALAMPCNTAHGYAREIQRAVSIPLLDMISLTVERIAARGDVHRVGLLASTAVIDTKLFASAFAAKGISTVLPPRQEQIMALIKAVKRGDTGPKVQKQLGSLASELAGDSDTLLVACSELSVIAAGIKVSFVDSLDVLAQAVVDFATDSTSPA
jgi:aspartate racemase